MRGKMAEILHFPKQTNSQNVAFHKTDEAAGPLFTTIDHYSERSDRIANVRNPINHFLEKPMGTV